MGSAEQRTVGSQQWGNGKRELEGGREQRRNQLSPLKRCKRVEEQNDDEEDKERGRAKELDFE